jgi:hypothetical protein
MPKTPPILPKWQVLTSEAKMIRRSVLGMTATTAVGLA